MSEKRRYKRYRKRVSVLFGEKDFSRSGYTFDLSLGGMFVVSSYLPQVNARIAVKLTNEAEDLYMTGLVRRVRQVPVQLRQLDAQGFGVQLFRPDQLMKELLPRTREGNHFVESFATADVLTRVYQQELRIGALLISTDTVLSQGTPVVVELALEFAQRQLEFDATVVHAFAEGPTRGLGVQFKNPIALRDALGPYLTGAAPRRA